jgi:hypothetical protein
LLATEVFTSQPESRVLLTESVTNNNLILFNNCFGWIKAELQLRHRNEYVDFAIDFDPVDYLNLAKGCARGSETGII